jgi:large subunit ribosomal protein L18
MNASRIKVERRDRRKRGLRKRIRGTAERPRLTVFRSNQNIYAQIIDDDRGVTLCEASTRDKDLRVQVSYGGNVAAAKVVGAALAERAKSKNVESVCFDRNGYRYHGRVKALAEAIRESGMKF